MFTPLKIALTALSRNKGRTALTILGIVIGISAVIAVMSAGEGIKGLVIEQVEVFGTNLIEVEIKVPAASKTSTENAMGIAMGIEITTLTLDDQEALKKLPNIKNSYAGVMGQQLVSYEDQNQQTLIMGVSAPFIEIDTTQLAEGRFFTKEEDESLANVVVLGSKIKEKLFGDNDFLDKSIRIGQQKFRIIGSMQSRGATFGFDMDDMLYLPVRTLQKKIMGINHVTFLMFQVYNNDIADETAQEMTFILRNRHDLSGPDEDDFHATPMTEALDILGSVFWAITLLLIAIAGVSLIVGGVGIMNIMYVSVMERTYEIGLRKAMGAKKTNILMQFIWEAILVTFLGAIIGILWGITLSWLISVGASSQGFAWQFVVLPSSLLLASGVSTIIGLTFGVFPALAAANMDPVEALRYNR